MKQENLLSVNDLWDRINSEIANQNRTKKDIARQCGFNRKILSSRDKYICTLYFARLCSVLKVSADYLLFGEEYGGYKDVKA